MQAVYLRSRSDRREACGCQELALKRTAHRGDAAGFVDRRADDGEIKPIFAAILP